MSIPLHDNQQQEASSMQLEQTYLMQTLTNGGEADSTLVGKPLLTYQEWDAGNPAPRSESELVGRQNAYDAYKSAWQSSNSTSSNSW